MRWTARCSTSVARLAASVASSSPGGIGVARAAVRVRMTVCATPGTVSSRPSGAGPRCGTGPLAPPPGGAGGGGPPRGTPAGGGGGVRGGAGPPPAVHRGPLGDEPLRLDGDGVDDEPPARPQRRPARLEHAGRGEPAPDEHGIGRGEPPARVRRGPEDDLEPRHPEPPRVLVDPPGPDGIALDRHGPARPMRPHP